MKLVILDALTLGKINLDTFKDFGSLTIYQTTTQDKILERCKDAEIIISCKVRFDRNTLKSLPNLKLIALTSTGTDMIDLDAARDLGIEVKNVKGYSTMAVAQHTLMLALALVGNLTFYDRYCKENQWSKSPVFTYITEGMNEIQNKNWGIIGLGKIGQQTAKLAEAFGAQIHYTSTSGKNLISAYPHQSLEELIQASDIISIHAPLNPQTYHLINRDRLKLLKSNAILINVGRGGIIDEDALAEEMLKSQIKFGSDVLEVEPMKEKHPLLDSKLKDRLILTPHTAWAYLETRQRLIEKVYENIKEYLKK